MDVSKEISERWKSLSEEDRIAITDGCMQEIEEQREAKDLAAHNVPLRAFHDARSTMQVMEKEVRTIIIYVSDPRSIDLDHAHSYLNCTQELDSSLCSLLAGPAPRTL